MTDEVDSEEDLPEGDKLHPRVVPFRKPSPQPPTHTPISDNITPADLQKKVHLHIAAQQISQTQFAQMVAFKKGLTDPDHIEAFRKGIYRFIKNPNKKTYYQEIVAYLNDLPPDERKPPNAVTPALLGDFLTDFHIPIHDLPYDAAVKYQTIVHDQLGAYTLVSEQPFYEPGSEQPFYRIVLTSSGDNRFAHAIDEFCLEYQPDVPFSGKLRQSEGVALFFIPDRSINLDVFEISILGDTDLLDKRATFSESDSKLYAT